MKAIVIDDYGGSDRLRLAERPDPRPHAGEILVRVRAAAVNPVDSKIRRGDLRLIVRLRFSYVPGGDIAGEVVDVGTGVTGFKPGDAVVAFVDPMRGGGYAELAVVQESAAAIKSQSFSFVEAASLPIAGCTALQALRDKGGLQEGGSALINGGAGGVGHFAVQIARALGARVTATCGPSNIAFVESLGADAVIDYTRDDFTRRAEQHDVVFDAVARSSFPACRHLLRPGGSYVTTLPDPGILFWLSRESSTRRGQKLPASSGKFQKIRKTFDNDPTSTLNSRQWWITGGDEAAIGDITDKSPCCILTSRLEGRQRRHYTVGFWQSISPFGCPLLALPKSPIGTGFRR